MDRPEIWIVLDDAATKGALTALLADTEYTLRAFSDGEELLAMEAVSAICILLDVRLPGIDCISVLTAMRARGITTPVVMLTQWDDVKVALQAMTSGAQDIAEKPIDDGDLLARVASAIDRAGGVGIHPGTITDLTRSETNVLREVVAGAGNMNIAHRLGMAQNTVAIHRARMMKKTGAKSASQLVRIALGAGLVFDTNPPR